MDTTAKNIVFNAKGECNFCSNYLEQKHERTTVRQGQLDSLVQEIKQSGKGKQYDCIVGVSGGVDSSYSLHLAVSLGLRPLAVHMDNGWNSELATTNIHNLVKGCGVDLYTHVISWPEYKGLMESFFKAGVIDIELLYDNAMLAVNYQQATKFGLKHLLFGLNTSTEGIKMPEGWNWFKFDARNIKSIHKKFGSTSIKTMPIIGSLKYKYLEKFKGLKTVPFLDYVDFNKEESLNLLKEKYKYRPYPYKHYESVFTRFYQGHILPEKFGVDKRRAHLSSLVVSGQMKREDAVQMLALSPYPSEQALAEDTSFFLKKMGWSKEKLDKYLSGKEISHDMYASEKQRYYKLQNMYVKLKKMLK